MINFILNSKDINKDSYVWNAISGIFNSIQSPVLLVLVSWGLNGVNDSAMLVIAYAIANLMMMIGKYGVRNYHVTDVSNQHSFGDYLYVRNFTTTIMLLASIIYVMVSKYDVMKMGVVLSICFSKAYDSYEDVYHSQLQKMGRLDIAGKILTLRYGVYFIIFSVIYIFTNNLMFTSIVSVSCSILFGVAVNNIASKKMGIVKEHSNPENRHEILKQCFPLFLCTFLLMYIGNAPKYTVDKYYDVNVQAAFNYIFMPVFVISLLGNFIFQPVQRKAAIVYKDRDYKTFSSLIVRGILAVVIITGFITLIGGILGIPVLSLVFNYNLNGYKLELILLLVIGGSIAFINMLNIFITLIRYQKHMIVMYVIVALLTKFLGDYISSRYSMISLVWFYFAMMYSLVFCLTVVLICGIKKDKNKQEKDASPI